MAHARRREHELVRLSNSQEDSVGGPCLRFDNAKVGTEQLIPLSPKATEAIRAQQDHVRRRWPGGSPWLFPGILDNIDGTKPYAHGSLSHQLGNWQATRPESDTG